MTETKAREIEEPQTEEQRRFLDAMRGIVTVSKKDSDVALEDEKRERKKQKGSE